MKKMTMENNNEGKEKIAVQASNPKSSVEGTFSLVFGILGLFILAIVFVPSALIIAVPALMKKQYIRAGIAIVISLVSVVI